MEQKQLDIFNQSSGDDLEKAPCAEVLENKGKVFPYEREITACFTGHRYISNLPINLFSDNEIKEDIKAALLEIVKDGYSVFMTGMAIGCDLLLAECILELRQRFRHLKLVGIIPCLDQTRNWNEKDQNKYSLIYNELDDAIVLSENYSSGCMLARNDYMVENASLVLAVWNSNNKGGTYYTVNQARKLNRELMNYNFKTKQFESI